MSGVAGRAGSSARSGSSAPSVPVFEPENEEELLDEGGGDSTGHSVPALRREMFRFGPDDDMQLMEFVRVCLPFEQQHGKTEARWNVVCDLFNAYLHGKGDMHTVDFRRVRDRFQRWIEHAGAMPGPKADAYKKMMARMDDPARPDHREKFRSLLKELFQRKAAAPELLRIQREGTMKGLEDQNDSGLSDLLASSLGGVRGAAAACPDRAVHGQRCPPENVQLTSPLGRIMTTASQVPGSDESITSSVPGTTQPPGREGVSRRADAVRRRRMHAVRLAGDAVLGDAAPDASRFGIIFGTVVVVILITPIENPLICFNPVCTVCVVASAVISKRDTR